MPPAHSFFKKKIYPRKSSLNLKQLIIFILLRGNIAIIQAIPKSYCSCCHWLSCADFQGRFFFRFSHGSCFELLSPLEKVPFATFYPRWKYLCGTYFSKKRLSQVDSLSEMFFEVKKSSNKQFKTASKFPQNPNKTLMENRHS